jgi:hypothetical protein
MIAQCPPADLPIVISIVTLVLSVKISMIFGRGKFLFYESSVGDVPDYPFV